MRLNGRNIYRRIQTGRRISGARRVQARLVQSTFLLTEQPGATQVWSGGSDESKEHGDARNTKELEANNGDDAEGPEVLRFGVHCAVYRLANLAAHSQGTRVPAEKTDAGPQREP